MPVMLDKAKGEEGRRGAGGLQGETDGKARPAQHIVKSGAFSAGGTWDPLLDVAQ